MRNLAIVSALLGTMLLCVAFAQSASWLTIRRDSLCVTEGAVEKSSGDRLRVDVPKMRAYATVATAQSAEVRFTYSGPTSNEARLGSGEMRRQFGLKLHAQDACNLVYAIWRIEPESKLVVSVKRNPEAHSSAECGNRGYQNIRPIKASAVPRLTRGQSHTMRAEMKRDELRVFVDNHEVWEGSVGQTLPRWLGRLAYALIMRNSSSISRPENRKKPTGKGNLAWRGIPIERGSSAGGYSSSAVI